jgi:endoglucanase
VQYAGINIAGFDFGCTIDGSCDLKSTTNPGQSGINQMRHFVSDDGLNVFRLPVAWQYLVNNNVGGSLSSSAVSAYDTLVQGCLSAGAALCIIDIHNYVRDPQQLRHSIYR